MGPVLRVLTGICGRWGGQSGNAGAVSEYNPAYQTPCFSDASPMHLRSSSTYSDALGIRLHMLCNPAPPPASVPPHVPPLLVCLFVYLFHHHTCSFFCF